jgi:hypothetical protein
MLSANVSAKYQSYEDEEYEEDLEDAEDEKESSHNMCEFNYHHSSHPRKHRRAGCHENADWFYDRAKKRAEERARERDKERIEEARSRDRERIDDITWSDLDENCRQEDADKWEDTKQGWEDWFNDKYDGAVYKVKKLKEYIEDKTAERAESEAEWQADKDAGTNEVCDWSCIADKGLSWLKDKADVVLDYITEDDDFDVSIT